MDQRSMREAMTVVALHHVSIRVTNEETTLAFYGRLGFERHPRKGNWLCFGDTNYFLHYIVRPAAPVVEPVPATPAA